MPRYFFHAEDGQLFCDEQGAELSDAGAARDEAVKVFSEILRDSPELFTDQQRLQLNVADETGAILYRLEVNGTPRPI